MKAKYYFKSISSEAEELKVKSYGVDIMTFKKEDFNGSWDNLVEKQYDLSPYSSADLSKIVSIGEEDHDAEYPGELKEKWYEYARNKIHEDFFQNTERLAEIDTSRPVELMNSFLIDTSKKLYDFITKAGKIPSYKNYLFDLSTLNLADDFNYDKNSSNARRLVDTDGYTIQNAVTDKAIGSYIVKLPKIPASFTDYTNAFSGFKNLRDISNLDTSQTVYLNSAFYNDSQLSDISNVNFENIEAMPNAFRGTGIEFLPDLYLPKVTNIEAAFSNCNKLKSVGNIIFNPDSNPIALGSFINSSILEEIGDIKNCPSSTTNDPRLIYSNNLKKVGNISTTENTKGNRTWSIIYCRIHSDGIHIESIYSPNKICKPIVFTTTSGTSGTIGTIGTINYLGPCTMGNASYPYGPLYVPIKEGVAISINYGEYSTWSQNSTGLNTWVDYTQYPNNYTKIITKTELEYKSHIDTIVSSISKDLELDVLQAVDDYPYDISIDKITNTPTIAACTDLKNCTKASASFTDGKIVIHLEAKVTDTTVVEFKVPITNIEYDATILGHPFHGKTNVNVNVSIDFTVTEDASIQILIEDDKSEEQTEQNT
jgi:hypothetical protein